MFRSRRSTAVFGFLVSPRLSCKSIKNSFDAKSTWLSARLCSSKPPQLDPTMSVHESTVNDVPIGEVGAANLDKLVANLSEDDRRLIIGALQHPETQPSSKMGGPGIGPRTGDMVAAFTCGRCEHRMVKKFSKHAYTKGIVIVQCPSCEVRHLLADNLGWFVDESKNIEEILREKGESFIRVSNSCHVESNNTRAEGNNNND